MGNALTIIDVEVAYESDLDKVELVLKHLCDEFKKEKLVEEIDLLGLESLEQNGLKYRLIVKSTYSDSFALSRNLKRTIMDEFNKNNITVPYNQVVIHNEL